ncbi:MAG: 4Fe-4S binding protein [Elusimicrobiota bacterium]|jgi:ferredoxin|nr:4Fe-4S binding protein [Elusimicrobiota bacterium]
MAHKILDNCINCGSCESVCPVTAISEENNKRIIDPDVCVDCGACKGACPVDAIEG